MAPLCNLIGLDTHNAVLRAEIIIAGNMIFYGLRFEQEKLSLQFPLHYITETLSEMKEVVPNIYHMSAVALTIGGSNGSCEASFTTIININKFDFDNIMNIRKKSFMGD